MSENEQAEAAAAAPNQAEQADAKRGGEKSPPPKARKRKFSWGALFRYLLVIVLGALLALGTNYLLRKLGY